MSMTMLTILQVIWVSVAYLGATLALPWLLLRRRLAQFRLPVRFMTYYMAGNFFCINLVLLLQLLHISNRATLIAGTLVPFLPAVVRHRKQLLELLVRGTDSAGSISEGELGVKTVALGIREKMRRYSAGWLARWLAPRWLDVLLAAGVVLLVLIMYGFNTVTIYGYSSSDLVVHNYWINYMELNQLFVDGVYPFGFHCVLYYLHEVFAIPTYVLLRVFALPQTMMIHLMLLAFLKVVCKSKYTPYVGMVVYLISGSLYQFTYLRYYAGLPQEYGMIFILPAAYFAIAFLTDKNVTSTASKKWLGEGTAKYFLILFGISISMTVATHFYDMIVVGLLCVGIGVGFWSRCLRWRYLKRLLLAGALGLLIGALPMVIAYASGTPLQGSLYWGMGVISGTDEGKTQTGMLGSIISMIRRNLTNNSQIMTVFILVSVGALLVLVFLIWHFLHKTEYMGILASFSVFMGLLFVLQAAPELGLPSLVEVARCAMYLGYGLAVVWSLCTDGAAYLLLREQREINMAGLVGLAAACVMIVLTGVRFPVRMSAFEPNGAMICLTNILRENRGNTSWTICSANDERQMVWGRGYHYDTITFLRNQEELTRDTSLTIPTDTVYFFIEKMPILYDASLDTIKPEREVSQEGAKQPLSTEGGLAPYMEDARWVTMSHMYYWAQAFQKLYPYEMEVYYETDEFVCYRVCQDGYNLYNFAIDYGYNT